MRIDPRNIRRILHEVDQLALTRAIAGAKGANRPTAGFIMAALSTRKTDPAAKIRPAKMVRDLLSPHGNKSAYHFTTMQPRRCPARSQATKGALRRGRFRPRRLGYCPSSATVSGMIRPTAPRSSMSKCSSRPVK